MKRILTFLLLISLTLGLNLANPRQAAAQDPVGFGIDPAGFGVQINVTVPIPPTPVKANGNLQLVYELHITNLSNETLRFSRLEVLGDRANTAPLATYEDAELTDRMMRYGNLAGLDDGQLIGSGSYALLFLQLSVEPSALPGELRHRLFFQPGDAQGNEGERVVEGESIPVLDNLSPLVIGAPLRGAGWMAVNGLSNTSVHRRAANVVNGRLRIAERYAIDWIQIGADGQVFHGDPAQNENWVGYGAELLAVADGVVVDVKDGIPENIPLLGTFAVTITLETIGGNYVIVDLGDHHYAFYAHLQPQSLRVKIGDKVRRGQVLGLLGNSGNSDAPHLHFHITDGNSPLGAEGIPYVFKAFDRQGTVPSMDVFESGEGWQPEGQAQKRQLEIPLENAVVRFP